MEETGETTELPTGFRTTGAALIGGGAVEIPFVPLSSDGWVLGANFVLRRLLQNHHASAAPRIATTGTATPTPIFTAELSPESFMLRLEGLPSESTYMVDVT